MKDIKIMDKGMKYAMEQLYPEIIDFDALGYEFQVPFYVFQGENDCITPISSAQNISKRLLLLTKKS
jgi:predicted esterase